MCIFDSRSHSSLCSSCLRFSLARCSPTQRLVSVPMCSLTSRRYAVCTRRPCGCVPRSSSDKSVLKRVSPKIRLRNVFVLFEAVCNPSVLLELYFVLSISPCLLAFPLKFTPRSYFHPHFLLCAPPWCVRAILAHVHSHSPLPAPLMCP
jgi:hypothetical protein